MTDAPAIQCRGLAVRTRSAVLLASVDLAVLPEEHVLLVGPSGSGKTTLLRAIAGLVAPSAGSVELFGRAASGPGVVSVPPEDRGVGMLFQGAALWPHMSVAGTLGFVLERRTRLGRRERRARIGELLDAVDLAGFERRRTPTLSGGEAQRLALARALAAEPRILLLDEPLGPLDAPRRQALLDRLAELERRLGLTTLHVTHDPGEAARVASRTVPIGVGGRIPDPDGA